MFKVLVLYDCCLSLSSLITISFPFLFNRSLMRSCLEKTCSPYRYFNYELAFKDFFRSTKKEKEKRTKSLSIIECLVQDLLIASVLLVSVLLSIEVNLFLLCVYLCVCFVCDVDFEHGLTITSLCY